MSELVIEAESIVKEVVTGPTKNRILDSVNLQLYRDDFTVIMGSSGAGKSTLLYALSGMDTISSGKVNFLKKDITKLKEKELATLRSNNFGFIFQQTHLVSNLTLYENVLVAGYLSKKSSKDNVQKEALDLMTQMNVEQARNRLPNQVSGGEAQRAAIARAMIHQPDILFADEPTGALNKRNTEEVLNLLTELNNSGQSILLVTHDVKAAIHGNRILYLEDGKLIAELSLPSFQTEEIQKREQQVTQWLLSHGW